MPGCADFEIAIDMRAHGALGDAEREALERHLSSCDRCRAYQVAAAETERLMQGAASEALGQVDWGWVRRYVRWSRLRFLSLAVSYAGLGIAAVFWLAHFPTNPAQARWTTAIAIVVAFIYGRWSGFGLFGHLWRLNRLPEGRELVTSVREELAHRIRVVESGALALVALAAILGAAGLLGDERHRLVRLLGVAFILAVLAVTWFGKRRWLAREQAALDGAMGRRQP